MAALRPKIIQTTMPPTTEAQRAAIADALPGRITNSSSRAPYIPAARNERAGSADAYWLPSRITHHSRSAT